MREILQNGLQTMSRLFFVGWCAGAGKTVFASAGAQELFNRNLVDLVIVFTLTKLKKNVCNFFHENTQLDVVVNDGTPAKRKSCYEAGHQVYVLNYDKTWADLDTLKELVAQHNTLFILDEALALDTPVLTRNRGWQTVGSVVVGDFVPGSKGWVRVCRKTEVFSDEKCFEVFFQGGESVVCTGNHLWTVQGARWQGRQQKNFDIRTDELPVVLKAAKHWNRALAVPTTEGIEYPERELPIDPYVLGYWLGDGDSTGANIAVHVDDRPHLRSRLQRAGYVVTREDDKKISVSRPQATIRNGQSFRSQLINLGVLGEKHIPEEYLHASSKQRLELLRGLMDSDGCASQSSLAVFTQKPGQLLTDTEELIRSLGIHCGIRTISQGAIITEQPAVQLAWTATTDLNPFALPRKADRITKTNKVFGKKITAVNEVDSVLAQCIEVEAEDHLFAVGRQWTLTHNCQKLLTDGKKNRSRKAFEEIVKASRKSTVWPMSATVVNHSPLKYRDVFSLSGGRGNPLGTKQDFEDRYAERKRRFKIQTKTGGSFETVFYDWDLGKLQEVRHRVSDRTQSVRKTDPAIRDNFKGMQNIVVPVQMSAEDRKIYDAIVEQAAVAKEREESLAPYYRLLRYVFNNPASLTKTDDPIGKEIALRFSCTSRHSSKLEIFLEQVESLQDSEEQVVVFTQWTNLSLFLLGDELAQRKIKHVLHFGVGQSDRESQVAQETFKSDPECTVFLSSDAGAYGLNFQNARYVISYEAPYSYDVLNQRHSRIDRADSYLDGLTSYVYITENSVEERIWSENNARRELASATLGAAEVLSYGKETEPSTLDYLIFGK